LVEVDFRQLLPKSNRPFVVVGIPAFNEERTIARVILEAQKHADVVVVCDDGSSDMTREIAERLAADVVCHEHNLGYGAAIKSLFERARAFDADVLVTMDADGQHDAAEIPRLLKPVLKGVADLSIGSRFIDSHGDDEMPLYRRLGAKLITRMVNGSAKNGIKDAQSGFRAYSRKAIERLSFVETGMGASVEILLKASKNDLKIVEVPSSCRYHNGDVETSTEHPVTHGLGVVMTIIRVIVERRPLMFLGIPAMLFLFTGVGFGVWMLQLYALEHCIVTNIALASIAFLLIGFFMLSTAVTLYAISRLAKRGSEADR
jgi:glycosyltransferase involved in cell wall biosynthesis